MNSWNPNGGHLHVGVSSWITFSTLHIKVHCTCVKEGDKSNLGHVHVGVSSWITFSTIHVRCTACAYRRVVNQTWDMCMWKYLVG